MDMPEKRILSPTQILSYIACPRKWYYEYVKRIKVPEKFALVRGSVVHKVCEKLFEWQPPPGIEYSQLIASIVDRGQDLLDLYWDKYEVTEKFGDRKYDETLGMVEKFLQIHKWKMDPLYDKYRDVGKAWNFTKPKRREYVIFDRELGLKGIIDAVLDMGSEGTILVDYKTSRVYRHAVSKEHERQMYIYALLFTRETGQMPDYVSVEYLLTGQIANYPVRQLFLDETEDLVKYVRINTESDSEGDYDTNTEYKFCPWCDFREICQGQPPVGQAENTND
jgi:CRISPR/Cas system-associated exonuclease Cas4 (RecB family)